MPAGLGLAGVDGALGAAAASGSVGSSMGAIAISPRAA